jgi:hypothetical protein
LRSTFSNTCAVRFLRLLRRAVTAELDIMKHTPGSRLHTAQQMPLESLAACSTNLALVNIMGPYRPLVMVLQVITDGCR